MTSKAALFALLAIWGVGTGTTLPSFAEEAKSEATEATTTRAGFTNRVWTKADDGALPDTIKIFLSDGTLVQDSCWETHRLSQWAFTSDADLKWNEDGMDVAASIVSLADAELVLKINGNDEKYTAATVPYVCPDMPKG